MRPLEIIRKYWSGERFDFHGKVFQLEDVDMLPAADSSPEDHRYGFVVAPSRPCAGLPGLGDGWQPYMYTAEQFRESVRKVNTFAAEAGRSLPADYAFVSFMYCSMHEDVDEARRRAIEQLTYRFNLPFEKIVDKYCAYGPPERIIENLGRYVQAGANTLIVGLVMPPAERMAYVERFASQILPQLQRLSL